MKEPSKSQKQAITHFSGPAQVIAGPGSGKTYTIIQRILYLIKHHHVRTDKILVITYTKAAAIEMKERYEKACSSDSMLLSLSSSINGSIGNVNFGTFHSICYQILRQSGVIGENSLIKENDKRKLFQIILCNNGFSSKCTYDIISNLQNTISKIKNMSLDYLETLAEDNYDFSSRELLLIKEEYDKYLREQRLIDFDDMITECFKLFCQRPSILNKYQQIFEYILTDEFQDINLPQYQILKLLALPNNNIFVVGDDDQAIYGFRGATPFIMKQFQDDYKDSKQILLTENYRSGAEIVNLAGRMISVNKERFAKIFSSTKEGGTVSTICFETHQAEQQHLIAEISTLKKEQLPNTAVILRTNREVIQFAELLKNAGIAVKGKKISDEDIYHGFIIEDITAFLSFLHEGRKRRDFLRFMNKPNRFLTRMALPDEIVKKEHMEQYYHKNAAMLSEIKIFFEQLRIAATLQPCLSVSFFRKTLGYDQYLRKKAKNIKEFQRLINQADQIQDCFKSFQVGSSVWKFIEEQAENAGNAVPMTKEVQGVHVITMHGAKGLEFDRVFLPDVNDGIIPGKDCLTVEALEEERRLLYVAITRAKNKLDIYYTKERGRKLSRFLEGIIPHL